MKNKSVFIVAEAGSNWRMGTPERDMKMATTLIDVASEAGADAIKFQTYRAHSVYVPNAGNSDYLSDAGIKESINKIFEDLSMPYEMIPKLAEHSKKKNIEFMSTPFSVEDAKAIDPYTNYHKIASYEISHLRLIEYIASTGKPTFLSTGASNKEEIKWALDIFFSNGGKQITLLQATAKYPASINSLNLKAMIDLKNEFGLDVGLSDHSTDPVIGPVTATALGASVIEKHFTLDKKLPGPDHSFALNPNQLNFNTRPVLPGLATTMPRREPPASRLWTTFPSTMVYIGHPVSSMPAYGVHPTLVQVSASVMVRRIFKSTRVKSPSYPSIRDPLFCIP